MPNPWIQTYCGMHFDLVMPTKDMICIPDIVHALSRLCRFTGHAKTFYSVAEHCCKMHDHAAFMYADPTMAYEALLHDAHEAYVGDVSAPLKRLLPGYKELQERVDLLIRSKYGLSSHMPDAIRQMDLAILMTERNSLFEMQPAWFPKDPEPLPVEIECWQPGKAELEFEGRYYRLRKRLFGGY